MKRVYETLGRLATEGKRTAVATVIDVSGSTYRKQGAKMLVTADGSQVGSISGGCLENDVARLAAEVLGGSPPRRQVYDMTADDDEVWGLGLGCNGTVEVYVEAFDRRGGLSLAAAAKEDRPACRVVIVQAGESSGGVLGTSFLVREADLVSEHGAPGLPADAGGLELAVPLQAVLLERARELLRGGRPCTLRFRWQGEEYVEVPRPRYRLPEGPRRSDREASPESGVGAHAEGHLGAPSQVEPDEVDVFFDVMRPPATVSIFGAGHDAIPLAHQASQAGFRVRVVDSRTRFLTPERFPDADDLQAVQAVDVLKEVPLTDDTYAVVMTHNYLEDLVIVEQLLRSPVAYIGMLGPRERAERILAELGSQGLDLANSRLERIFAPVGLDLGGEGPERIALSIVAEIAAVSEGRRVQHLADRQGAIHAPVELR